MPITMSKIKYKTFKSFNNLNMVAGTLFNWEIITKYKSNTGPKYLLMHLNNENNTDVFYNIKEKIASINNVYYKLHFTDLELFVSNIVNSDGTKIEISPLYKK